MVAFAVKSARAARVGADDTSEEEPMLFVCYVTIAPENRDESFRRLKAARHRHAARR
jgi:hypothetical protein